MSMVQELLRPAEAAPAAHRRLLIPHPAIMPGTSLVPSLPAVAVRIGY